MKKFLLFLMTLMVLAAPQVIRAQSELTVHDGTTTNGYVPLYGWYADAYLKCEMVYPAAELSGMNGGSINSMTFYASQTSVDWGNAEFQVFVAEVSDATISAFAGPGTVVYEGALSIADGMMTVEFDAPYTYNGGNLLVGVYETTTGSYVTSTWYGESVTGASVSGYSYSDLASISATQRDFLPKTTFAYTPAGGVTCEKPDNFTVSNISGYGADFAWTGTVGNYTFEYKKASEDDWTVVTGITANTYTLSNLETFTAYNARVKAVCSDVNMESGYKTANFTTLEICPDGKICIGQGTATNSYLPTYNYYNYSLTEQIYTADEIGVSGAIESIDIYSVGSVTRTLDVYMVSTTKSAFADGDDWVSAAAADLVYSGQVAFAANSWNTITLDNPFIYDGTSNVALVVVDQTGSWVSSINFFVFDAPSQAIYKYNDNFPYNPSNPGVYDNDNGTYSGTVLGVKNRVRLVVGEPPTCLKPMGLTVNNVTNHTADLSWTENGTATAWQICLNGDESNLVDVTTNPYTLTGLDAETTYTVKLRSNCGTEDGMSDWTSEVPFTTEIACPAPTGLSVVPTPISAEITWTGDASNYNLCYGIQGEPDPTQPATIILTAGDVWGDGSGYQMLLDADATAYGTTIPTSGALSANCSGNEEIYAEFEYKVPATADGNCTTSNIVMNNSVSIQIPAGTYDWCITNPTPDDRIWIASSGYGNVGGREDDYEFQPGMVYEFVITQDESGYDRVDLTVTSNNVAWVCVNNVTSPYTINGLTAETEYCLKVQAVCGGIDGESAWTNTIFTTPSSCDAPSNLEATEVNLTSATLEWTGYQTSYNVQYRTAATYVPVFEDDFENGLSNWTIVTNAEVPSGQTDGWYIYSPESGGIGSAHSGSNVASSWSWASNAYHASNWLISPQIQLGGVLRYYVKTSANWPDHYEVLLSTHGNDTASFERDVLLTLDNSEVTTGEWEEIIIDLSEWAGQQGYIALHHSDYDANYLFIDDFGVYNILDAGDWTTVTANEATLTLDNLTSETEYEWQVQGVNASCDNGLTEWSEIATFTTPSACDVPTSLEAEVDGTTVTLSWTGVQDTYDVSYYSPATGDILIQTGDLFNGYANWTPVTEDEESGFYYLASDYSIIGYGFSSTSTPQYLISPEFDALEGNSFVEFMYYAPDGEETFQIGYSTTDDDVASFTWGDAVTVEGADYYDAELPAGAKYFAIQYTSDHTADSTNLFVLDITVVSNYIPAGDEVVLNGVTSPVTITGLDPETTYEWAVRGIFSGCSNGTTDWSEEATFTTGEETITTQTIVLAGGANWVSFNVETNLNDLKAALVATGNTDITIQGQTQNAIYNPNNGRWTGQLRTLDLSKMYVINVANACEITLEGMPIDPSMYPITIEPGVNWIAYPFNTNMTVTNAFAGFAVPNDNVQSQQKNASYNGTRWTGQLRNLEPGQGYIYNSASTDVRVFTYPAGN